MSDLLGRRTVLRSFAVGAAVAAAGCSPMRSGSADTFVLRFSHVTTAKTPKGKAAEYFKRLLEERTGGRIRVELYPNSELYGDKDEMQAIQSNSIQMLAPASAKFTTVAPSIQVLDLPFVFDSPAEVPQVVTKSSTVGKAIYANTDVEKRGMKVLGLWDSGMKQIHSNNRTVAASDMKGKKYRIQPSDILRTQFEKWGGVPTPLAFAEVYSGLQQGLIDGGENTYSNIESQKMHTVQKFIAELNHGYIGYVHVINKKFFDSLPADLQGVVVKTADDAAAFNRKESIAGNEASKQTIEAAGGTKIVVPTSSELKALKNLVMPSVYETYRSVIGSDIVDELLRRERGRAL
ncbi:DctP family TRAP transporter solute-binding subunit [Brevibacterium sp. BRM-1]|uniref:DctP family TRAP transporter solute-binding subunit n=1 Tax=Brevibacterium sp. BRM-1 TaxID=2999062 RepID=UPI002281F832|nr:DctP family TRAP transporter solute-binding subunit [Brevibacterium sp. BRM-1]WAL39782.1 DctP family TRAP transporter solute-binding subunit [Brevibacterium sp. BRM-1]